MGWLEEQYKNTQTVGDDGYVSGRGLGAFLWQQFVDEDALNEAEQKRANQRTAIKGGETLSDLQGVDGTSSTLDVEGAVIQRGRQRRSDEKDKDNQTASDRITQTQAPQMASIRASTKAQQDQTQLMREQMVATAREANLQRADAAEARAAELQYQMLRDRKADRQYNERLEQLDRRDAKNARASIIAGLASLGAAFAM